MWTIEIKIISPGESPTSTDTVISAPKLSDVVKKAIRFLQGMGPY